jgi:hypothetical protein
MKSTRKGHIFLIFALFLTQSENFVLSSCVHSLEGAGVILAYYEIGEYYVCGAIA